jgi:hypothetical protein
MPTYLDALPEDIRCVIYRHLYTSVLSDMKNKSIYKNTKYFHKLLEVTGNPFIYDLDYLGMLNITSVYDIFKYRKTKIEYDELFCPETAIYQRSHFTKDLDIVLDNIEISNEVFYALYKSNKRYYRYFMKEYIRFDCLNALEKEKEKDNKVSSISRHIYKATFILNQTTPFRCLAELLYNVIELYNSIKDIICKDLYFLESLEDEGHALTQRQKKDKYILEDILGQHINNRFIIRFDYDIDNRRAYPILLPY